LIFQVHSAGVAIKPTAVEAFLVNSKKVVS